MPSPETPSLSFTSTCATSGLRGAHAAIASTTSSSVRRSSRPSGCGTPSSAKSRRQPLFVPSWKCSGRRRTWGCRARRARSRSSSVVLYGTRCARSGSGISSRMLPDQPRPLEELLRQRPRGAVERRDEEEPLARVRRDHAREQVEVVVDDARQDRLRGDVDEPRARLAQEQEQEQEALLVGLEHRAASGRACRGERRDDDDRLLVLVQPLDRLPQRDEPRLQLVEGRLGHAGIIDAVGSARQVMIRAIVLVAAALVAALRSFRPRSRSSTTWRSAIRIAYGIQPDKADKSPPAKFDTGYVDVRRSPPAEATARLVVVNYGCPGESTVTFVKGGCPGSRRARKLHNPFRGTQLAAALALLESPPRPGRADHDDARGQRHHPGVRRLPAASLVACVKTRAPKVIASFTARLGAIVKQLRTRRPACRSSSPGCGTSIPGSSRLHHSSLRQAHGRDEGGARRKDNVRRPDPGCSTRPAAQTPSGRGSAPTRSSAPTTTSPDQHRVPGDRRSDPARALKLGRIGAWAARSQSHPRRRHGLRRRRSRSSATTRSGTRKASARANR